MCQQYVHNIARYIQFDSRDSIGDYGMKNDTNKQSKGVNYEKNTGTIDGVHFGVFAVEF